MAPRPTLGEMHACTVTTDDGVDLAVVEQGEGPGLVLVHGFSGAKEDFTEHFDELATTHHVVCYDQRGHGASSGPEDTTAYSLQRLATDVVEVADALGFEHFRLLGVSLGGMVAQHVVLDHPHRVDALVLMNTWPGPVPGFDRSLALRAGELALTEGIEALWAAQRRRDDPLGTPAHRRLLRERAGYAEYGDRKFLDQSPHMYAAVALGVLEREDLTEALRAVRCPTLVVVGKQDDAALPGCLRLAEAIPGARLARIPDAGHSPQFENPVAWRRTLFAFLEQLDR